MHRIAKLMGLPNLKKYDIGGLKFFSSTVRGAVATHNGYGAQLECYSTLLYDLNKLPTALRRELGKRSYAIE